MKNVIKAGQTVIANFGAMFPIQEYTVYGIDGQNVHLMSDEDGEVVVEMKNIRQPGERSANGSPIGYELV